MSTLTPHLSTASAYYESLGLRHQVTLTPSGNPEPKPLQVEDKLVLQELAELDRICGFDYGGGCPVCHTRNPRSLKIYTHAGTPWVHQDFYCHDSSEPIAPMSLVERRLLEAARDRAIDRWHLCVNKGAPFARSPSLAERHMLRQAMHAYGITDAVFTPGKSFILISRQEPGTRYLRTSPEGRYCVNLITSPLLIPARWRGRFLLPPDAASTASKAIQQSDKFEEHVVKIAAFDLEDFEARFLTESRE